MTNSSDTPSISYVQGFRLHDKSVGFGTAEAVVLRLGFGVFVGLGLG